MPLQFDSNAAIGRRAWMQCTAAAAAAAAWTSAGVSRALGQPAVRRPARPHPDATPAAWSGRNRNLGNYYLAPGYPPYDPHPRYIGQLDGTWFHIGQQYGERAGDFIRLVYEGWYRELVAIQGSSAVMAAYLRQQEAYYRDLLPEGLELMAGIAAGAATELQASAFARELSHPDKILMINSYFGLQGKPPVGESAELVGLDEIVHCCSGAVMLGDATRDGKTIHVSSEDQHFFPQEYLVTFTVNPSDKRAHRYTVTDTAGEIGSEHAMNDQGVACSGYAGGGMNILKPMLSHPFSGYRRPGLDWQVGNFYAVAFASTAQQAVELLTVGRPGYRTKSGNKIVIGKCTQGANWVVSDPQSAFVVESIPSDQNGIARYAIRKPGAMGEKNARYIVSTNNVEANYSFNEQNVRDDSHPMSQHGSGAQHPVYFGLNGMGTRFWTFMWLIHNNYGAITPEMVQEWRKTHFFYDTTGLRHDSVEVDGQAQPPQLVARVGTLCRHTSGPVGVDTFKGINIYVTLSVAQDLMSCRTKGRPCEWVGPWDALSLHHPPPYAT